MIALFNEKEYIYISNRRSTTIITNQKEKASESFDYEDGIFYRTVENSQLSDIFRVEFLVDYKSNLENVPDQWVLGTDPYMVNQDGILLIFAEGILPGWKIIDKNICTKRVSFSDVSNAIMRYIYKKKDGIYYDSPVIIENQIPVSDLRKYRDKYTINEL